MLIVGQPRMGSAGSCWIHDQLILQPTALSQRPRQTAGWAPINWDVPSTHGLTHLMLTLISKRGLTGSNSVGS